MSPLTDNFILKFSGWVVKRCGWVILASLVLVAALTAGAQHLVTPDVGVRNHFKKDDPHLINLELFEETYAVSDSILVIVAPADDTIFTRDALMAIEELTDTLWLTPYAIRVDSITNYLNIEGTEDSLIVEALVEDASVLDDAMIDRVKSIALNTQDTAGRFVSRDGRLAGLVLSLALPDDGRDQPKTEVATALGQLVGDLDAENPDIDYYMYGELLLDQEIRNALNDDQTLLAPLAFATMILVAAVVLRSVWGILGIMAMLISVMASSFGFAGWSGLIFYGDSAAAIFVLMAIAIAHSVHLIEGVMNAMRDGMDRIAATVHSLTINVRPIFLTSVTTAIGFLSLNFSESPPFQVMGNIVAFGAMIAFVYSMTLLPAFIALVPLRAPVKKESETAFSERLGHFVIGNSTALLWIFAVLAVVGVIGIARIELDESNVSLLNKSYPVRQSADFINENFSGLDSFEYSLNSGKESGVLDLDYLRQVESFTNWLREQPEVTHASSLTDVLKRLNETMNGGVEGSYSLPENTDLAAQYLLLYELSLPVGRDLNSLISFDRSESRLTIVIESLSAQNQIAFDDRASAWLRENAPNIQTSATGVTIVSAYSVMRIITNMLVGTMIAMAVVSLILIFVFRSLRFGLLSLIPNFMPAIMAMAVWGYAVGTVSVAASIVTAIAFGIIVDDTIHLMSKYLRSRAEGMSPRESIVPTFKLVGRPLLTTTFIFALGFLVFGASGLSNNQTLGTLVGITVIIALLADFLLFPPLLIAFDKTKLKVSGTVLR